MKLTFQKILISVLTLVVSIAACVFGMYLVILANMKLGPRFLFCAVFMLQPVMVILMMRFMFKKPVPKDAPAEGEAKKKKWGSSGKDAEAETMTAGETVSEPASYEEPAYSGTSYSETSGSGTSYSGTSYSGNSYTAPSYSEPAAADPMDLDDDLSEPQIEKAAVPVTEESVGGVKKISLKRKKKNTDAM